MSIYTYIVVQSREAILAVKEMLLELDCLFKFYGCFKDYGMFETTSDSSSLRPNMTNRRYHHKFSICNGSSIVNNI